MAPLDQKLRTPAFPAQAPHVALFLLNLSQSTASYACTTQAVAAMRWSNEKAGFSDPNSHGTKCSSLRRIYSRPVRRRTPLCTARFKKVLSLLASPSAPHLDLQVAAIFVLDFCGFLRWENMCGLWRRDLEFCKTRMTVHFGKRKNYQLRDCDDLVSASYPLDGSLCPVAVVERFIPLERHAPPDPSFVA